MGIRLPRFGWFAARPRVAWCCRWVLGSVAIVLIAASLLSVFLSVTLWLPGRWSVTLWMGELCYESDPIATSGKSLRESFGTLKPGFEFAPVALDDFRGPTLFDLNQIYMLLPGTPTLVFPEGESHLQIIFSVWLLLLPILPPALAAWRNRWVVKRDVGTCRTCGYSRAGLAGGVGAVCPECGEAPRP